MKTPRSRIKRLFLFAGYNAQNKIDDALVYYLAALSRLGDIVLVMDSDVPATQMKKVAKYTLHAAAVRHGEYDFGSYRRAYVWAHDNLNLTEYDFIYLINDSVYGPFFDLAPYLSDMESRGWNAFGMVKNPHHTHPHIQSWFVGMDRTIFTAKWFDKFMRDITRQASKGDITREYEQGLTKNIMAHGGAWGCLYTVANRGVYNLIAHLYRKKMPFMKKLAFSRRGGALGAQIAYVLRAAPRDVSVAILSAATAQYGEKYMAWLLTRNPVKILWRNIRYGVHKLVSGGI